MKKCTLFRITLSCFLSVILSSLVGCSDQNINEQPKDFLYEQMINYSNHYAELKKEIILATRSGESVFDMAEQPSYDLDKIDPKFLEYFDLYCQPEDFCDWDERGVLSKIDKDVRFSQEEKEQFVQILAGIYFFKNEVTMINTRSDSPEDQAAACEMAFHLALARASRNFIIGMAAAIILEPTLGGESLAVLYYYAAIQDAETDYNLCMAAIKRDGEEGYSSDGTPVDLE